MKKVGKYIIISLLLLLGLCCVGVLYLFFVPNSSLFNITYINLNKKIKTDAFTTSEVSQLNMNSRAYDVNIMPTDKDKIYLEVYSNSFGFVLKANKEVNITSSLKDNILTIDIKEPYGFATKNSSYINVYIPNDHSINLNLSNKKATTSVKSENIKINNLSYSTEKGDFKFIKGSISGTLKLNLKKSTFSINSDVVTNSNPVELFVTKGKFLAENAILGDVEIKQNERGVIKINECAQLLDNIATAGGQINVKKVSFANIKTSDSNITIGETTLGVIIEITGAGSVKIDKILNHSVITTQSGNITIQKCETTANLHTDTGNINVSNAKKTISVQTNYGDINVAFSEDAEKYTATNNSRTLYANIYNGKLTATGVEHVGVANTDDPSNIEGITITGNGRVNLTMSDVVGENKITGNNVNINIVVNYSSKYILNTSSTKGSVRVNLLQISDYLGYTTKTNTTTAVNCSNSSNTLNVSTNNGDLTLLDSVINVNGF